jgi:DNA polymerase III epsilon subunit-like protein
MIPMEKFIVIDTETAGAFNCPLTYDIGFAVVDKTGHVYESHSYVIGDIFLDNKELMKTAYYADKIDNYWRDINSGKRKLRRFSTVKRIFKDVCDQYGIRFVVAHNARFDDRALKNSQRVLSKGRYKSFFPRGIILLDSLKMARAVFSQDSDYRKFCLENNYITKRNQLRFTAEILYRFLINDTSFIEEHMGLEDVMIEKEILAECLRRDPEVDGRLYK